MTNLNKLAGISALALVAGAIALVVAFGPGSRPYASVQSAAPVASAAPAVATLGSLQLSGDELNTLLDGLPEGSREQLRSNRGALEGLIRGRLAEMALLEQAEAQGWQERPDIQQMTDAAVEQIVLRTYLQSVSEVPDDYPDEQTLQLAYDGAKDKLQTPALYRVSQVFLAVEAGSDEGQVRKKAIDIARRAQATNTDFAALAKEHSEDHSTAQRGGDSGLQPLQQYVPAMRQILTQQQVGAVSDPLRSEAGYHILKLTERQPARPATLAEVREQLRQALRAQRQEQVAKAYMEGLVSSSTLSIDGAQLSQALEPAQ
ncbi:peptidylprolyl isomerase [Ectopseudomonas chengduensis]|nr:peptidylprolyl isomerase [Pseudomonas chengduensis]UZT80854.1 peptidylprolyl isomerase [Pseudomonas chengduensis]